MKKLFLTFVIIFMITFFNTQAQTNPDGSAPSLTMLGTLEMAEDLANSPKIQVWFKWPVSDITTFTLYFRRSNEHIYSKIWDDTYHFSMYEFGFGGTVYFR